MPNRAQRGRTERARRVAASEAPGTLGASAVSPASRTVASALLVIAMVSVVASIVVLYSWLVFGAQAQAEATSDGSSKEASSALAVERTAHTCQFVEGASASGAFRTERLMPPGRDPVIVLNGADTGTRSTMNTTCAADITRRPIHLELPKAFIIEGVPSMTQARTLSCEFQAASDLAWYYGKPFTWDEIFVRVGHDRGGNPHKGFVGQSLNDPAGELYPYGYGVYAEPVARALCELGLDATVHYRESLLWLQEQLAHGRPVLIWAVAGMRDGQIEMWAADDGTVVQAVRYEHTFLVVGYQQAGVWVIDPWDGKRYLYDWGTFLRSWDTLNRMSIVIDNGQ